MMSPMIEIMENVTSTRILFQSALQAYLDACSAFRKSALVGEFPLAKLESFTSNELAGFTSHEGKLQTTKALLGNVQNHTKPIGSLPSEILSHIFHLVPLEPLSEGSRGYFRFPKRLEYIASSCSRWRRAALDTPSLWSYLCFAPQIALNRSLISRSEVYAARAGELSLKIDIAEYGYDRSSVSLAPCDTEDNLLLEFLASVAHRISSIELTGSLEDSQPCGKLLETCLAGATPGILTELHISHKYYPQNAAIGSVHDTSQILDLTLDMPVQRLEDILSSVTSLTLRDARFPWASRAFNGLVELHLGSHSSRESNYSEVEIPESHLCRILSSSPGLRVFAFNMHVQTSHLGSNPVTPFPLEDLEVFDLRGIHHSHLATVLRLVSPGSKLSVVRLSLAGAHPWDFRLINALKSFFRRVNAPKLGLVHVGSLQWLVILRGLVNSPSVIALQRLRISHSPDVPVNQWENSPTVQHFADRLHISDSRVSLTDLISILDMYRPRTLTLWQSDGYLSQEYDMEQEELITLLSQKCPYANVLRNDEPDPAWDRRWIIDIPTSRGLGD